MCRCKNNQPIVASQLVQTEWELGHASLYIVNAYANHSGLYTVNIANSEGTAAASATVKVEYFVDLYSLNTPSDQIASAGGVASDVQHEKSWQRIQQLEAAKPGAADAPSAAFPPPSIRFGYI